MIEHAIFFELHIGLTVRMRDCETGRVITVAHPHSFDEALRVVSGITGDAVGVKCITIDGNSGEWNQ